MLDLVDVILADEFALSTIVVVEVRECGDGDEEDGPVTRWQVQFPGEDGFGDAHVLEWTKHGWDLAGNRFGTSTGGGGIAGC